MNFPNTENSSPYVLNSEEASLVDRESIHTYGIDSRLLMGWAGYSAFSFLKSMEEYRNSSTIHFFLGKGNNAGDGYVIAWHILTSSSKDVTFWMIDEPSTPDANYFYQLCLRASRDKKHFSNQVQFFSFSDFIRNGIQGKHSQNIVIDAIFGTGLNKTLTGEVNDAIKKINKLESIFKVSVDIASGVFADGSFFEHNAVKADYTITFGFYKIGHLIEPGIHYSGKVDVLPIGFYKNILTQRQVFQPVSLNPLRKPQGNKYTSGIIHIIGGSTGMEGAAILSGVSFLKSGGGLAKIFSTSIDIKKTLADFPQLMIESKQEEEVLESALERMQKKTENRILVIGPGLKIENINLWKDFFYHLFEFENLMGIFDASLLSEISEMEEIIRNRKNGSILFTPHKKEAERILKRPILNIHKDSLEIANRFNVNVYFKGAGGIVILKDERNLNSKPQEIFLGSSRYELATGGTGDIFTGMAAAGVYRCQNIKTENSYWNECMINQAFSLYYSMVDETVKKKSDACLHNKDWFFADMSIK